jgi:type II secretory pathway pseudopilin PulG
MEYEHLLVGASPSVIQAYEQWREVEAARERDREASNQVIAELQAQATQLRAEHAQLQATQGPTFVITGSTESVANEFTRNNLWLTTSSVVYSDKLSQSWQYPH